MPSVSPHPSTSREELPPTEPPVIEDFEVEIKRVSEDELVNVVVHKLTINSIRLINLEGDHAVPPIKSDAVPVISQQAKAEEEAENKWKAAMYEKNTKHERKGIFAVRKSRLETLVEDIYSRTKIFVLKRKIEKLKIKRTTKVIFWVQRSRNSK